MGNEIKVELLDTMGDDLRHVNGARATFENWKAEFGGRDEGLIDYLVRNHETEPMRHIQATLRCQAPIAIARQLQKHQVGFSAWSEVSRRYVTKQPEYYDPDVWNSAPPPKKKQGNDGALSDEDQIDVADYYYHAIEQADKAYHDLLDKGVCAEQARLVLPQAMMTTWVWTGSLQAWWHLCWLRNEPKAQEAVQKFAAQVQDLMREVAPVTWGALERHS